MLSLYHRIVPVFILFILVSSFFSNFGVALTVTKMEYEITNNEYIIELKDKTVSQFSKDIRKNSRTVLSIKSTIRDYKEKLLETQNIVKNKILSLFDEVVQEKISFSNEFTGIFNGFCINNVPESMVSKIRDLPFVKSIFPNYQFTIFLDYSIPQINVDLIWDLKDKTGANIKGKGISIAILDTGVDYTHPDLANSYVEGYDFINNDNDPMDDNWNSHGTHCAGILVGNGTNSEGQYVGVAPYADLYVYKVLDHKGNGNWSTFLAGLQAAMDPNGDDDNSDHVDIISISFGTNNAGSPNDEISKKIDEIVENGTIVVTAAGNLGPDSNSITSPGCSLKAITVGSIDKNDIIASYSSRGPVILENNEFIKPDVVAPGVNIYSASIGGGYRYLSGTSMAAPHVAGAAALLLQAHPEWTPEIIKEELEKTSKDLGYSGKDNTHGSGRIDVFVAMNLTTNPPMAILDISDYIPKGVVNVIGTAMNGTGNSDDFVNYSLHFRFNNQNWILIYENTSEVQNSILFTWNTSQLDPGLYELKLVVNSVDQANITIKEVHIGYTGLIVEYRKLVFEGEKFTVEVYNCNYEPISAFVIFLSPFHIPRVKYGYNICFEAPIIYNPFKENMTGKICIVKIKELQKKVDKIEIIQKI
jgi:serine protease AprX